MAAGSAGGSGIAAAGVDLGRAAVADTGNQSAQRWIADSGLAAHRAVNKAENDIEMRRSENYGDEYGNDYFCYH